MIESFAHAMPWIIATGIFILFMHYLRFFLTHYQRLPLFSFSSRCSSI